MKTFFAEDPGLVARGTLYCGAMMFGLGAWSSDEFAGNFGARN